MANIKSIVLKSTFFTFFLGGLVFFAGHAIAAEGDVIWPESNIISNIPFNVWDMAIGQDGVYMVGESGGDWQIEKKDLSGSYVWRKTYNPPNGGASDVAREVSVDSNYVYVGGNNGDGDSVVLASFSVTSSSNVPDKVVTWDPDVGNDALVDEIVGLDVTSTGLYLAVSAGGYTKWQVERRELGTLANGCGGQCWFKSVNPSGSSISPEDIAVGSDGVYIVGWEQVGGSDYQMRVEKRKFNNGDFDAGFGSNGVVKINPNTSGKDSIKSVAVGSDGLFIGGYKFIATGALIQDTAWYISKLSLSTGGSMWTQSEDPTTNNDNISDMAVGTDGVYVVGLGAWEIKKLSLANGTPLSGWPKFGASGGTNTEAEIDSSGVYIAGWNSIGRRVEKRGFVNNPPVADARISDNGIYPGTDKETETVNEGETVYLWGQGSNDPDAGGSIASYSWSCPAQITLNPSSSAQNPTFTAPQVGSQTGFTCSLTVTDNGGLSSPSDSVTVTVNDVPDNAPIANAGNDQTVNEGALVTLDGSGSSGSISSYAWSCPGISFDPGEESKQNPTFTAPQVIPPSPQDDYTCTLTVNGTGSDDDSVRITVKDVAVNQTPIANAGANQEKNEGESVTLDGSGSYDPDGSINSYAWSSCSAGVSLSDSSAQKPTFTAPQVASNTTHTCTLTVTDNVGAQSASDTVDIVVYDLVTLSVAINGSGSGTVTSNVGGVNCGVTCSAIYRRGTSVTLAAAPDAASEFGGWNQDCSGTGSCSLTMNGNKTTTATFSKKSVSVDLKGKSISTNSYSNGPIAINSGGNVDLSWSSTNVSSCSASASPANSNWNGNLGVVSGAKLINGVTVDTSFTITCSGTAGNTSDTFSVRVPSVILSANPSSGSGALNNVSLTATVSGGVANATYRYFFDCNDGGSNGLDTGGISGSSYTTAADLCGPYNSSASPKVTVYHSEANINDTTDITITAAGVPTASINIEDAAGNDKLIALSMEEFYLDVSGSSASAGISRVDVCFQETSNSSTCTGSNWFDRSYDWNTSLANKWDSTTKKIKVIFTASSATDYDIFVRVKDNNEVYSGEVKDTIKIVPTPFLTLTFTGNGSGAVNLNPPNENCSANCVKSYSVLPTDVTLTATPNSGSEFKGWGGDCSVLGKVTMDATGNKSCTAQFDQTTSQPPVEPKPDLIAESLSINPANPSAGQAISFYANIKNQGNADANGSIYASLRIDTNSDSVWDLPRPDMILTNAYIGSGNFLPASWITETSMAAGTHQFEICADNTGSVVESFENNNCSTLSFTVGAGYTPTLKILGSGTGKGTVIDVATNGLKINCQIDNSVISGDCTETSFVAGNTYTLRAQAIDGSNHTGWAGACSDSNIECQATILNDTDTNVWAGFDIDPCSPDRTPPTAPTLVSPTHDSANVVSPVRLKWKKSGDNCVTDAEMTYNIYFSASGTPPTYNSNVRGEVDSSDDTGNTLYADISFETGCVAVTYYWNVEAKDKFNNLTSAIATPPPPWRFTTNITQPYFTVSSDSNEQVSNPLDKPKPYNVIIKGECGFNDPVTLSIRGRFGAAPPDHLDYKFSNNNNTIVVSQNIFGNYPSIPLNVAHIHSVALKPDIDRGNNYYFKVRGNGGGLPPVDTALLNFYINRRPLINLTITPTSPEPGTSNNPIQGVNPLTVKLEDNSSGGLGEFFKEGGKAVFFVADLDNNIAFDETGLIPRMGSEGGIDRCYWTENPNGDTCNGIWPGSGNFGDPRSNAGWTTSPYNYDSNITYGVFDALLDKTFSKDVNGSWVSDPAKSAQSSTKTVTIVNSPPVAVAGISREGIALNLESTPPDPLDFKQIIDVPFSDDVYSEEVTMHLASWQGKIGSVSSHSKDLNGVEAQVNNKWTHDTLGISDDLSRPGLGGAASTCEWDTNVNGTFGEAGELLQSDPSGFAECAADSDNILHPFTGAIGVRSYQALRISDRAGGVSTDWSEPEKNGTVQVNVKPVVKVATQQGNGEGIVKASIVTGNIDISDPGQSSIDNLTPTELNCSTAEHSPAPVSDCLDWYNKNTIVMLDADPDAGSIDYSQNPPVINIPASNFSGWTAVNGQGCDVEYDFVKRDSNGSIVNEGDGIKECIMILNLNKNKSVLAGFSEPQITIAPESTILRIGQTMNFKADYDADGSGGQFESTPVTEQVVWKDSENGSIVSFKGSVATAKGRGVSRVILEYGGFVWPSDVIIKVIRFKWQEK